MRGVWRRRDPQATTAARSWPNARGTIARGRRDFVEAEAYLIEAVDTFEAIQSRLDAGRCHLAFAELLAAREE